MARIEKLHSVGSLFGWVEPYLVDPILSLVEVFKADPRTNKINLGIGIYTDEQGRLPVLASVLAALLIMAGVRPPDQSQLLSL